MLSGHGARLITSLLQVVINNVGIPYIDSSFETLRGIDMSRKARVSKVLLRIVIAWLIPFIVHGKDSEMYSFTQNIAKINV
jgi:hypothetical protein